MADPPITEFLKGLGLAPGDVSQARAALEEAGLTRPGKVRLAEAKLERARQVLAERFALSCGAAACQTQLAGDPRPALRVARPFCPVCGGSNNALAVAQMVQAMERRGLRRLLVIGGTPRLQRELTALLPSWLECRFVLNGDHRNSREAAQEAAWADVIVVWASTPIPHKVTTLYSAAHPLLVTRRGLAALAEAVVQEVERRAGGRGERLP